DGDARITRPWTQPAGGGGGSQLYQGDTATGRAGAPGARGGAGAPAGGARGAAPAFDPKLDTMVSYAMYSVIPSPVDDTVWGVSERFPGFLIRLQRGTNAPESCKTQIFKVPEPGFDPRGADIDSHGTAW